MKTYEITVSWEVKSTIKIEAESEDVAINTAQDYKPWENGPFWSKPEYVTGSDELWADVKVVDDKRFGEFEIKDPTS